MIKIYTAQWCPYCQSAKKLLAEKKYQFIEVDIEKEGISRDALAEKTGAASVPQIIINDIPIGGYTELVALTQSGKLSKMMTPDQS